MDTRTDGELPSMPIEVFQIPAMGDAEAAAELNRFLAGRKIVRHLREQLIGENYALGNFRRFRVFDPKERMIHAAAFPERVIHHAVMNVCEPVLERRLIFHTFAGRPGKGQYAALEAASSLVRV
ncbi:MAG: hypothetical protein JJT96_11560 [Opitutales bacterium]|nr:hypothetical protein [Opitutales bacterium]